ncbi:MAG TPA: glutamate 5-kinase [Phycisphaerae bacterium]|nr:glutamate 5-kinase [Phycisphaerae bacterium]
MTTPAPDPQPPDRRSLLAGVRSVVIKIGTNALSDPNGRLDTALISHFAQQVAALHAHKIQVTLVSSGAIGAGVTQLHLPGRPKDLPTLQAAASVGQSILMNLFADAFRTHNAGALNVGQILITRGDFEDRSRYLNLRNCIHALHKNHAVPIINENDSVAVAEIRFGDNDLIAAQVTHLLRADLLILLTVVDGLLDPAGNLIPLVQDLDDASANVDDAKKSSRGTGGMTSKLVAAGTVRTAGEPVLIANGKRPNIITDLLAGAPTGTLILPAPGKRLSSRSRWIGLTARTKGSLTVDAGAAAALRSNKSLLATGITAADGHFDAGDPVLILDPAGHPLARGLSNYSHEDLALIRGHKSTEFPALLHTDTYYDEVIHKDDLVLE